MTQSTFSRTVTGVAIAQVATPASLDLVAAVAGLRVYVTRIILTSPAIGTLQFLEGAGGTPITGAMNIGANGLIFLAASEGQPILQTAVQGNKLTIVSVGVGSGANGIIYYYLDT